MDSVNNEQSIFQDFSQFNNGHNLFRFENGCTSAVLKDDMDATRQSLYTAEFIFDTRGVATAPGALLPSQFYEFYPHSV